MKCLPTEPLSSPAPLPHKEGSKLEYSNPEIPEGINTSKTHPLKEFLWLTGGVMATIFVLVLVLMLFADVLTSYIPFSVEQKISLPKVEANAETGPLPDYLQSMADRIARAEDLPEDMKITVHYLDDDTVNAFATLGGHVFFFRGLLEKLPSENALAMLMAHEIAHIKHRHPIRSLGRGVIAGLALSIISTAAGNIIIERFLGSAGYLTILKYNRDMESQADETAIQAVKSIYGHLGGADELFKILQQEAGRLEPPVFFSTHPLTEDRLYEIKIHTSQHSAQADSDITPLPLGFEKWIEKKEKAIKNEKEEAI